MSANKKSTTTRRLSDFWSDSQTAQAATEPRHAKRKPVRSRVLDNESFLFEEVIYLVICVWFIFIDCFC